MIYYFLLADCVMLLTAKEIADLWMEYEENSTPEAKIVKDFDKVWHVSISK